MRPRKTRVACAYTYRLKRAAQEDSLTHDTKGFEGGPPRFHPLGGGAYCEPNSMERVTEPGKGLSPSAVRDSTRFPARPPLAFGACSAFARRY
eukprot:jgi/Pico_ML_1/53906/g4374.t1